MRKPGEKIHSIAFTEEGCSVNGAPPVKVQMPADVAPPGSLDDVRLQKPTGPVEPTEAEEMEERALQLARLINHRREKSNRTIREV